MKGLFQSIITLCFICWLLPLGFFIKPSHEKMACDGRRAVCMCSSLVMTNTSSHEHKLNIHQHSTDDSSKPKAGGTNLIVISSTCLTLLKRSGAYHQPMIDTSSLYNKIIDHVPKLGRGLIYFSL